MDTKQIKNIVEGALLGAGRPLSLKEIGNLFSEHDRPDNKILRAALGQLDEDYADRGIELREVASGYRIQIRPMLSVWLSRLWQERPPRYSRALLETLALVAYRQPITRGEIEDVRGVAVSTNIIRTLLERSWIRVVGHRDVPGRPEMFGTTREFLDYFDLKSLDDMPPLAELTDFESLNVELELGGQPADDADDDDDTDVEAAADDATAGTDDPENPEADENSAEEAAAESMTDDDTASEEAAELSQREA